MLRLYVDRTFFSLLISKALFGSAFEDQSRNESLLLQLFSPFVTEGRVLMHFRNANMLLPIYYV